jgi:hypothetical protein
VNFEQVKQEVRCDAFVSVDKEVPFAEFIEGCRALRVETAITLSPEYRLIDRNNRRRSSCRTFSVGQRNRFRKASSIVFADEENQPVNETLFSNPPMPHYFLLKISNVSRYASRRRRTSRAFFSSRRAEPEPLRAFSKPDFDADFGRGF